MRWIFPAFLLLPAPALAQDDAPSLTDIDYDVFGPAKETNIHLEGVLEEAATGITPTQRVDVRNDGGSVTVMCMATDQVSARVTYAIDAKDKIAAEWHRDGIKLTVYESTVKVTVPTDNTRVKSAVIDLAVRLPTDAVLNIRSRHGWVQAVSCNGPVTMEAGEGDAYLKGEPDGVWAIASQGSVVVDVTGGELSQSSSFKAEHGRVELTLPAGQDAEIEATGSSVQVQGHTEPLPAEPPPPPVEGQPAPPAPAPVYPPSWEGTLGKGGIKLKITAGQEVVVKTR